ncbi:MAG: hypothetical protein IJ128_01525 [Firmicutes bacterium]|nr:hypothetical protein [Bacillota bacterium]
MNTAHYKLTVFILIFSLLFSLSACGGSPKDSNEIDLTRMSATMVYSEVFDMLYKPEEYMGKTIKMRGALNAVYNEEDNSIIFACIIQDAIACCEQGVEFRLKEEPDVYPEGGTEVTVVGTYDTYERDGEECCYIKDAVFVEQ